MKISRRGEAGRDLARALLACDQHRLARFLAGPSLRADIISRRKTELGPIPESRMVARMIVDISNQYIERQPPEKLMQSRLWITETEADRLCKILIARIARLHLVQPKHGKSGDHGTALPPKFIAHALNRQTVGKGKSWSVRVNLGGSRIT